MNENHIPTPKKRSGWIGFFYACLLLLLITLIFGFYWWHSDADLVDIQKKAAANNIPVTWAEFGLKKSEPDRLARWRRIVALSKRLPPYQELKNYSNPKFVLFSPIPAEMRAHHASLDQTTWTELLNEIDLLGDQPLCFRDTITLGTLMYEIGEYRTLARLLQERSVLAEAPEALRLCSIQLALCRSFDNNNINALLVKTSLISLALSSVNHHLAAFRKIKSPLAEDITLTTELYPLQLIKGLTGEFLCRIHSCTVLKIDNYYSYGWYMPLAIRAGRHEFLTAQIESLSHFRDHDLLSNLAWQEKQMTAFRGRNKLIPSPGLMLCGMTVSSYEYLIKTTYETQLKGRLLAAELKNQPWPQDIFDPTGATLRPVLRDGKIIGAYTVSSNGIDDGGDKKLDRYFPLYGPLELPVAPTAP